MPPKIRRSFLVRSIAAIFIYLIVLGNIWFAMSLTTKKTPEWMLVMFLVGVMAVLILGFVLAIYLLYLWHTDQLFESVEGEDVADSDD